MGKSRRRPALPSRVCLRVRPGTRRAHSLPPFHHYAPLLSPTLYISLLLPRPSLMGNPPPQTPQPPPAPSWQQTFEYYNPLHRRRKPTSPPVLSRDFAYAHNGPTIILAERPMRHQINAGTSAKTFAEYVHLLHSPHHMSVVGLG